jgi:predicted RNA-binding protein with TRAM domain
MPRDVWGMASASANGMLVLSNGVVENNSAVTNATIGYDPSTDEWVELAASGSQLYRVSMSCGIVKAGGRDINNAPVSSAEQLEGFGECGSGAADVAWLSSDTTTVTIEPGDTVTMEVTMSAKPADGIDQPGGYSAALVLNNDAPYGKQTIDVTMSVAPKANMGKVDVTVLADSTCDGSPVPLEGAQVQFLAADGVRYDLATDGDGNTTYWLKKAKYTVIVSKDGWAAQATVVTVKAGKSSEAGFTLAKVGCQAVKTEGGWLVP